MKETLLNAALAYIGKKLDVLIELSKGNKIQIDLGSSTTQLEKAADTLSKSAKAIDSLTSTNEKSINKVVASLGDLSSAEKEKITALVSTIERFEDILRKESNHPAVSAQVEKLDSLNALTAQMVELLSGSTKPEHLKDVVDAVKGIKLEEKETDLTPVLAGLQALATAVSDLQSTVNQNGPARLEAMVAVLNESIKSLKLNIPKEFKLDDMQMRTLANSGKSGGAVAVIGGDDLAKYKVSDIDDDASPNYYGFLDASGAWYIMKEDTTAKTYRYIAGRSAYTTAWTNRASHTYVYFNAAHIT